MTQLTNHGIEDRIVDFFMCHKVSQVDLSYWQKRVDQLRGEYRKREKFLNPISGTPSKPSTSEIEDLIDNKLEKFAQSDEFKEVCKTAFQELLENNNGNNYKSKIVESEEEIIELSNKGYQCQPIGENKWLMRKEYRIKDPEQFSKFYYPKTI